MENNVRSSPTVEEKWGDEKMSEVITILQKDVKDIKDEHVDLKVRQAVLEETQTIINATIKESVTALTDNVKVLTSMMARMEIQSINTEKSIELKTQDLEFRIKQVSDCNERQEEEIKKMNMGDFAKSLWANPIGKLLSGIVVIALGFLATKFGIPIDTVLK